MSDEQAQPGSIERYDRAEEATLAPTFETGNRLTSAQVAAELGEKSGQNRERAGQPHNPDASAGADTAALRVQNASLGTDLGPDRDGGQQTRAAVEAVIAQNPG